MTDEIPVLENASENTNTLDGLWGGGSKSSHWCCACGQMSAKQEV
jgi:hypothetical protein